MLSGRYAGAAEWITSVPRRTVVGFFLIFGIFLSWSLATPRYAAPDEPAHTIKAAATVRGEFLGHHMPGTIPATIPFTVPATIAKGINPICVAFKPRKSAACLAPWRNRSGLARAQTYVGRYPPLGRR